MDQRERRIGSGGDITLDVTRRDQIRSALDELCAQRRNCELRLGSELFTSIFLKLADESFLIDILMPRKGNEILRKDRPYTISFQLRSVPYSMKCSFAGSSELEGWEALLFSLPEVIKHSNRRSSFRVAPSGGRPMRISIDFGVGGEVRSGEVKDISTGGVAVRSGFSGLLRLGQRVSNIKIDLPGQPPIICSGMVRRLSGTVIGVELEKLGTIDHQQISRFVSARQQEDIASGKQEF